MAVNVAGQLVTTTIVARRSGLLQGGGSQRVQPKADSAPGDGALSGARRSRGH